MYWINNVIKEIIPLYNSIDNIEIEPDGTIKPFDVPPPFGFRIHSNKDGKELPLCCEVHSAKFQKIAIWAKGFLPEKEALALSHKTILNLAYTEYFIDLVFNHDDSYEEISDLLEFNIFSFGSSPYHAYYYLMELLGFMTSYQTPFNYERSEKLRYLIYTWSTNSFLGRDLFLLRKTFDRWFKSFPFEVSFLSQLKDKYDLFFGMVMNDWTEHDDESFTTELNRLTGIILAKYNTLRIYRHRELDDPTKLQLELIVHEQKLKIERDLVEIDEHYTNPQYKKMILKWFKNEIKFVSKMATILLSSRINQNLDKKDESIDIKLLEKLNVNSESFPNPILKQSKLQEDNNEQVLKNDLENAISLRMTGRFCRLVADSGLKPKGEMDDKPYCKTVCEAYKFKYTDNVRQWYANPDGARYDLDIVSHMLPMIPKKDAKKIKQHLSNK